MTIETTEGTRALEQMVEAKPGNLAFGDFSCWQDWNVNGATVGIHFSGVLDSFLTSHQWAQMGQTRTAVTRSYSAMDVAHLDPDRRRVIWRQLLETWFDGVGSKLLGEGYQR